MRKIILLAFMVFCASQEASSQELFDIVKVSCVNEASYLNISHEHLYETAINFKDPKNISVWQKSGFYDPRDLSLKCKLSKAEYELKTSQAEKMDHGMCSQSPQIELSLIRNGVPIIQNVIFGESCFGNTTISRVAILDKKSESVPDEVEVCYANSRSGSYHCQMYMNAYYTKKSDFPITTETVENHFNK